MITETLVENRFDTNEFVDKLEIMKAEMYFPDINPPSNIRDVINRISNQSTLRMISPDELSEYGVLLGVYAMYLTIQENRIKSFLHYCESNIKHIVGRELCNSPEYGFEAKNLHIRSTHPNIVELDNKKFVAEIKLEYIKNISFKIHTLIDTLKSLVFEKHRLREMQ